MLQAMKWVINLGLNNIIFEGDSKIVVDTLNSGKKMTTEFGAIITHCKKLLGSNLQNSWVKFT